MEYPPRSLTNSGGAGTDEFWINTPPSLETPNKNGTASPTPETVAYQALRIPSKGPIPEAEIPEIPLEPFNALSPTGQAPYPIPEYPQSPRLDYNVGMSNEQLYMSSPAHEEPQEQFSYPKMEPVPTEMEVAISGVSEYANMAPLEIPTNFDTPTQFNNTGWPSGSVLDMPQSEFESTGSASHTPSGSVSDSSTSADNPRVSTRVRRVCRSCAKDHKQCVGNPCSRCQQRGKECIFDLSKVPGPKPKNSPVEM